MERRVVITGLGIVSPVGNNVPDFWRNIQAGVCGIDWISRFDTTDFKVKIAAELKDFDPLICLEKAELRKMDRFTQYAVVAAQEAVTDSGIAQQVEPRRFGVYIGSGVGGIETLCAEGDKLRSSGPGRVSPYFVPMMIGNMAAGTVAIRHNCQGPCLPVITACASSTNAIGEAFRAIKHGYAEAILAGGTEAPITPLAVAGFTSCMALSKRNDPKASCMPFDKRRDGFVMGEGAGVLVLEERDHARSRGARIYGEIKGYGHSCDAHHITAPHPEGLGASGAICQALDEANAWGFEQLYINAHGTSTPLNDKGETLAIKTALGQRAYEAMISSSKSMTGHMLGAAGAAEAIVSILALGQGIAPPTIGYEEPDPDCDLDYVPNIARAAKLDTALSLSLGFGGHNACVVFVKE